MMTVLLISVCAIISYLLGSIPTAVWYGKAQYGIDIREYGSGNAGATNTFRVLGKKAGVLVMLIDILKGFAATALAALLIDASQIFDVEITFTSNEYILCQLGFGVTAVIGHIFPIYANFKGGKGVATLLGMIIAVDYEASLACLAVFVVVFLTTKYVSLGSMIAALTFPLVLILPWLGATAPSPILIIFGFVLFSMVVLTHRKNINRLIHGEENKANFRLRKNRN